MHRLTESRDPEGGIRRYTYDIRGNQSSYTDILGFVWKQSFDFIEQELIDLIRTSGKEKNYELIEYVNDVNRQYAETLMELNENGYLDTAYTYGNERLSADRFEV